MRKKIRFFWIWTFAFCLLAFTKDSRATFRPIYQAMLSQLDKEYVEFSKKYFFKYERIFQSFPKDREMYLLSELRKIHQEHTLGSINITKNFIKKSSHLLNKLFEEKDKIVEALFDFDLNENPKETKISLILRPLIKSKYFKYGKNNHQMKQIEAIANRTHCH